MASLFSPSPLIEESLLVHYSTGGSYQALPLLPRGDEHFALIPPQAEGTMVQYYIAGENAEGDRATHPSGAPETVHAFTIDAWPPRIRDVMVKDITNEAATVIWATDEAASSRVRYGTVPPLDRLAEALPLVVDHAVMLQGLEEATEILFEVESVDEAGNVVVDNNGGAYYHFNTARVLAVFQDDMEGGEGEWTHVGQSDVWEYGTPTVGPSAAHSGASCWGTDLDDDYPDDMNAALVSPPLVLEGREMLTFWHWFDLESGYDNGVVEISGEDGIWENLMPGSTFTGASGGWVKEEVDLAGRTGPATLRFRAASDGSITRAGWYIDDVTIGRIQAMGVYLGEMEARDDEPQGDGDGFAEPGEGVSLHVTLINTDNEDARGVVARLLSADPCVTLSGESVSFGDIPPNEARPGAKAYSARINEGCAAPHTVEVSVEVSAGEGGPWWDTFRLNVRSVSVISGRVMDLATGEGLMGATVTYSGPTAGSVSTDDGGAYAVTGLEPGEYIITASTEGYSASEAMTLALPPDGLDSDFWLGAPAIHVSPLALEVEAQMGQRVSRKVAVSNQGNIPLAFTVRESRGKGEGGPDGYGYRWMDSHEPQGPTYEWIDITATGQRVEGLDDDTNLGPFEIGFDFPFYGEFFRTFRICSNGWISFTSTSTGYSEAPLPSPSLPENLIAPFYDDLDFGAGGEAFVYSNQEDRLVVSWIGVRHYSTGGPYSFQVILHRSGRMVFQYGSLAEPLDSCTVGIQNQSKTDGITVASGNDYLHEGLAVEISYDVEWLDEIPLFATVAPGESEMVEVLLDGTLLAPGIYSAQLQFHSNDPLRASLEVPVTFQVGGDEDGGLDAQPDAPVFLDNPSFEIEGRDMALDRGQDLSGDLDPDMLSEPDLPLVQLDMGRQDRPLPDRPEPQSDMLMDEANVDAPREDVAEDISLMVDAVGVDRLLNVNDRGEDAPAEQDITTGDLAPQGDQGGEDGAPEADILLEADASLEQDGAGEELPRDSGEDDAFEGEQDGSLVNDRAQEDSWPQDREGADGPEGDQGGHAKISLTEAEEGCGCSFMGI